MNTTALMNEVEVLHKAGCLSDTSRTRRPVLIFSKITTAKKGLFFVIAEGITVPNAAIVTNERSNTTSGNQWDAVWPFSGSNRAFLKDRPILGRFVSDRPKMGRNF